MLLALTLTMSLGKNVLGCSPGRPQLPRPDVGGIWGPPVYRIRIPAVDGIVVRASECDEPGCASEIWIADQAGEVVRIIKVGEENVVGMRLPSNGRYAGVLEDTYYSSLVRYRFRYYDAAGYQLWSTTLCCVSGDGLLRVVISDDGSTIGLLDLGYGETLSADGSGETGPPGGKGLRIFSWTGRLLYQQTRKPMTFPVFSSNGRYVVFQSHDGWRLVNTRTRHVVNLPQAPLEQSYPVKPDELGNVTYSTPHDGKSAYRYYRGAELLCRSGP